MSHLFSIGSQYEGPYSSVDRIDHPSQGSTCLIKSPALKRHLLLESSCFKGIPPAASRTRLFQETTTFKETSVMSDFLPRETIYLNVFSSPKRLPSHEVDPFLFTHLNGCMSLKAGLSYLVSKFRVFQ